jgi:4-alpha-glucanotransferase
MRRQAGVVLPLFSIRTRDDWGIGQLTALPACAAWILQGGQRLLQVLPPHTLSPGETSPYGALTAFGVDPIYADVNAIADLDAAAIDAALGPEGKTALAKARASAHVDYDSVRALKFRVFDAAFARFLEKEWEPHTARAHKLAEFMRTQRGWLDDLALYETLRASHGGWSWTTWPEDERDRSPNTLSSIRDNRWIDLLRVAYVQWTVNTQWEAAHARMRDLGVELMGDVPFVVGSESADVWSHAAQFQRTLSLGAPPDDFSADGQDWGLPPYDWLAMESDDLAWVRMRTRHAARLYDRFRVDHVVGYFRQWVRRRDGVDRGRFDPAGTDAQRARGRRILRVMIDEVARAGGPVDSPRIIAEDLGVIPPFVRETMRDLGMPGYKVLPWEKDDAGFRDPKAYPRESVASWSTHDTAPIDAWWPDIPEYDRIPLAKRAGVDPGIEDDPSRSIGILGDLYQARSDLALVLAQELLGLKDRINTPATVGPQNWTWRLPRPVEDLATDAAVAKRMNAIRALAKASGR